MKPTDASMLFEQVFIGLYDTRPTSFGSVGFFDVLDRPPKHGRPKALLSLTEVVDAIIATYDSRNRPPFEWEDSAPEPVSLPPSAVDDDEGS